MAEERQKRVLVVDDEKISSRFIGIELKKEGYETCVLAKETNEIFDDLEQTVEKFQPDAAIVSNLMGKCCEVVSRIKKTSPETFCIIYSGDPNIKRSKDYQVICKGYILDLFNCLASNF